MMKLQILSDLHTEFGPAEIPDTDADAIILAGDIGLGMKGTKWALSRWRDKPILYLAGNHEYYRQALPELTGALTDFAAGSRLRFMENTAEVLDGVRFLGCTLWTDFDLFGRENRELVMAETALAMSDYQIITKTPEGRLLEPADTRAIHQASRQWLEQQLAQPFAGPTVVITHHAPAARSVNPRYKQDPVSAGYASHLDDIMSGQRITLWIHGHTHHNVDYVVNGTRVLTNQYGYPQAQAEGFDPVRIVEI